MFQAGQTFVKLALFYGKMGNKHDAAMNYVDAANCFKKSDPKGDNTDHLFYKGSNAKILQNGLPFREE